MNDNTILIIGGAAALFLLSPQLQKKIVDVPAQLITEAVVSPFIVPYQWASNYHGYIPIIDDLAAWASGLNMSAQDYERKILGWSQ
jgi:hypothetical protein